MPLVGAMAAHATTLPPGFQESTAFSGLTQPIAVEFAPNGRVFVAEKSGIIKTFTSLSDTSATQFADLRTKVHNYWDRGHDEHRGGPELPRGPVRLRVLRARRGDRRHGAALGRSRPDLGRRVPPRRAATEDGCVVSGRISRLQVSGETMTGPEQVLVEDWCQQYPSHAGGGLEFGADGNLYFSGGEGASWTLRRLRPGRQPRQPVRRPAGRRGRGDVAADRRGRAAALAGHPHDAPTRSG